MLCCARPGARNAWLPAQVFKAGQPAFKMNKTTVFIGPTWQGFSIDDNVNVMPPAQQGDIAGAAAQGAETIVLIDGYFTQHLAPWHKEILFALDRGVRVLGAASLGALRAVECERYGMEPIGSIANWYKRGFCFDDAEVALIHTDEGDGCRPLSVPLVNIRATAIKLAKLGLVHEVEDVVNVFRRIHYTERSWKYMDLKMPDLTALLKSEYVDQKAEDAKLAIETSSQPLKEKTPRDIPKNTMNDYMVGLLTNDIRFPGNQRPWEKVSGNNDGIDSWLFSEMAMALGIKADLDQIENATKALWEQIGITDKSQAEDWFLRNGVSREQFNRFTIREAVKQSARDWLNSISRGRDFVPITYEHELLTKKQKNVSS